MHESPKNHLKKRYKNNSDLLTHNFAHKSAKKTVINQQRPNPQLAEVEGKGVETSFFRFFQINRCGKLKTEKKPWIGKYSKRPHRHLYYYFS